LASAGEQEKYSPCARRPCQIGSTLTAAPNLLAGGDTATPSCRAWLQAGAWLRGTPLGRPVVPRGVTASGQALGATGVAKAAGAPPHPAVQRRPSSGQGQHGLRTGRLWWGWFGATCLTQQPGLSSITSTEAQRCPLLGLPRSEIPKQLGRFHHQAKWRRILEDVTQFIDWRPAFPRNRVAGAARNSGPDSAPQPAGENFRAKRATTSPALTPRASQRRRAASPMRGVRPVIAEPLGRMLWGAFQGQRFAIAFRQGRPVLLEGRSGRSSHGARPGPAESRRSPASGSQLCLFTKEPARLALAIHSECRSARVERTQGSKPKPAGQRLLEQGFTCLGEQTGIPVAKAALRTINSAHRVRCAKSAEIAVHVQR